MRVGQFASCLAVSFGLASAAGAADRHETTFFNLTDDNSHTPNVLRHGTIQADHDLEGTTASPDNDWMMIRVTPSTASPCSAPPGSPPSLASRARPASSCTRRIWGAGRQGKAVALEPATGFTFDTQILPLPR